MAQDSTRRLLKVFGIAVTNLEEAGIGWIAYACWLRGAMLLRETVELNR
jgi:hypothetical protein